MNIKKINDFIWEIKKENGMNVPGIIYASEKLFNLNEEEVIKQIVNVAKLPGIVKYSIAMPDMHQGYGFCIGGVAAFDAQDGIVCPGGVGFDINCGVRVMVTNIKEKDFLKHRKKILSEIDKEIPTGLGFGLEDKIDLKQLDKYLIDGAEEAIKNGFGYKEDLDNCEEKGKIENTDIKTVSQRAKSRGLNQLGTLGSGNHFIEIQVINEIFNPEIAKKMGLDKDNICLMIHSGSRGLGHQIASDYIKKMEELNPNLDDKQLSYVKINSKLGQEYLKAMNCAVNFAFANRQIIMYKIRNIFQKYFKKNKFNLLYDVCHNIAKIEEHIVNNKKTKLLVHRKGATRAKEGEIVIIPGSMGTNSYILIGGEKSENLSFESTAHGAGRIIGRKNANKNLEYKDLIKNLEKMNIEVISKTQKGLVEESPEVYKDIQEVIDVSEKLKLTKKIVSLKPIAVIKG